jgi:hypothetical protein
VLNLANSKLGRTLKPNGWTGGSWEADWGERDDHWETDMKGIIALANAIPDMGALTSLNLSSNNLNAEGAKIVAEAILVTYCEVAVILAPFSCPSH